MRGLRSSRLALVLLTGFVLVTAIVTLAEDPSQATTKSTQSRELARAQRLVRVQARFTAELKATGMEPVKRTLAVKEMWVPVRPLTTCVFDLRGNYQVMLSLSNVTVESLPDSDGECLRFNDRMVIEVGGPKLERGETRRQSSTNTGTGSHLIKRWPSDPMFGHHRAHTEIFSDGTQETLTEWLEFRIMEIVTADSLFTAKAECEDFTDDVEEMREELLRQARDANEPTATVPSG